MKRSELRQLIKEELFKEGSYNADRYEVYLISYYEESYQYKVEYFTAKDKKEVEKHAISELNHQYLYRPTDKNLWAEIKLPVKWKKVDSVLYKK